MLYHHSYYCVSPLPLLNVISFTTTTVSTTSASLDHSYILDHCFFRSPLFVWTTTTSLDCDDIFGFPLYLRIKKAVCDHNFRFSSFEALRHISFLTCFFPSYSSIFKIFAYGDILRVFFLLVFLLRRRFGGPILPFLF